MTLPLSSPGDARRAPLALLALLALGWVGAAWAGEGNEAAVGGGAADPAELLGRLVQVLGFLLALAVAAALLRRYGKRWEGKFSGGPIQLLAGRNFAPGVGVRLIRVGSRSWLVGVSRERVVPIAELTAEEVAQALREPGP
ncbi:MAG: flagellar biosynthetic protein FliO [Magnetococcales bacterium]|nr:flagellar biosynthetic protein FliO [Magnetococcales bacterium]